MIHRVISTDLQPYNPTLPTGNGVSVLIALRPDYKQVVVFIGPTSVQRVPLPFNIRNPLFVEFDGANLWITEDSKYGQLQIALHQLRFDGSALSLVKSHLFGDLDTRVGGLILRNGQPVLCLYQFTITGAAPWVMKSIVESFDGVTWKQYPVDCPSSSTAATSCRCATIIRPDGKLWWLIKRDGSPSIDRVEFDGATARFTGGLISQAQHGQNGPDGEIPILRAWNKDGAICVSYQRNEWKGFSTNPFVKGCTLGIAKFSSSDNPSFEFVAGQYIERLSSYSPIGNDFVIQPLNGPVITGATVVARRDGSTTPVDQGKIISGSANYIGHSAQGALLYAATGELILYTSDTASPVYTVKVSGNKLSWNTGKQLKALKGSAWEPMPEGSSTIPEGGMTIKIET